MDIKNSKITGSIYGLFFTIHYIYYIMNTYIKQIEKYSSLKNIFYSIFILTMIQVVFSMYIMPEIRQITNENILDVRIFYHKDEIVNLFSKLGDEGRKLYIYHILLDLIYPFAYTSAFLLLLGYFSSKAKFKSNFYQYSFIFPVLLIIFDLLENTTTLINLKTYPNTTFLFNISGYLTVIKHGMLVMTILSVTAIGLLALKENLLQPKN